MALPAGHGADLSGGVRFIRRAGDGADRQPRHPAAGSVPRTYPQPSWPGSLLAISDGVLAGRERFRDSSRMLGGSRTVAASDLRHSAACRLAASLRALSVAFLRRSDF